MGRKKAAPPVLSPLRDVIAVLCPGAEIPLDVVPLGTYSTSELTEAQNAELQDHCCLHAVPDWNTGIGIMDAADAMVQEAVDNGNIRPKGIDT